jgi:nucleotide-binding universal stress UspA family protein
MARSTGRKVTVALDTSDCSRETIQWALKSILQPNDEVTLLSVLEPGYPRAVQNISPSSADIYNDTGLGCKPDPSEFQKTQDMLKEFKEQAIREGITDVKGDIVVSCIGGSPDIGRHIVERAASSDLLVMGSRRLPPTKKVVLGLFGLGSVSDWVVKHSKSSCLIHK